MRAKREITTSNGVVFEVWNVLGEDVVSVKDWPNMPYLSVTEIHDLSKLLDN
jgi:hypothetical protein